MTQPQAPMAMIVQDFDTHHPGWDAANGELLEVAAGTAVRLLDYAEGAEYWRVELVSGGRAGLVARACALPTASGGKGDWSATKGTADATIAAAVEQGFTSENFDLSKNVANNDTRLVDPAVYAMEAIMEREGCSFDEARNLYNRQKMVEAGIDPDTGLSLDPKAVTNQEDFERVFAEGRPTFPQRVAARFARSKAWWGGLISVFGMDFVIFISLANFLFGMLTEWYAIFLSYYLKDDLGIQAGAAQAISATAGLAYQLRPLCGLFSDSFPLLGSTRHSWFFASAMAAVASQALLLVVTNVTVTTILLFLVNFFGGTWVFVISGAMIAEVARKDPVAGAENLQTVQWGFYSLGMFCGDLSAGPLYISLCSARACFAMSMMIYFALAFTPFTVKDYSASKDSTMSQIQSTVRAACSWFPGLTCADDEDNELTLESARDSVESTDSSGQAPADKSDSRAADNGSAMDQLRKVWRTVDPNGPTEGALLRPAIYIFFCVLCVPDYYYGATYYFYVSQPIQEANGCPGAVRTTVQCTELPLRRGSSSCDSVVLENFAEVPWPTDYTPVAPREAVVFEWEYTGVSNCSSCEAFRLPAQKDLCKAAGNCELRTLQEGAGCEEIPAGAFATEDARDSGYLASIGREDCVELQTCQDIAGTRCQSDTELEQKALARALGVRQIVQDPMMEALDAMGEVNHWLLICGGGQCEEQTEQEEQQSDSEDVCTYSDGYGYGYGYGPSACEQIVTARYFAVLRESDSAVCHAALCNVTVVDDCTAVAGGLGFDPTYYSHLQALGSAGSIVGTFVFGSLLAESSLRRTFAGVHIALALVGVADATLALRWNVAWGIDDKYFAGLDQFMYWLGYQCKMLPIYSLATRICPPGVEATMIAVVLSLKDLGYTFATYYGALLTSWAGIEENVCGLTPFDNLWMLYSWRILCRLMPVVAVVLVPTEEQIAAAIDKLAQADIELAAQKPKRGAAAGLSASLSESDSGERGRVEGSMPDTALHTTENPAAAVAAAVM